MKLQARLVHHWFSDVPALVDQIRQPNLIERRLEQYLLARRTKGQRRCSKTQVPVVVVGNLVAGGGGKTPLIVGLVKALTKAGLSVGVVCSGYGSTSTHARRVLPSGNPSDDGDEAIELAQAVAELSVAVFAGKDRASTVALAERTMRDHAHPLDLILSDDGLQHFAMARSFQLLCIDRRGLGNQRLIPFGPLREPIESLQSMDAIVLDPNIRTSPPMQRWTESLVSYIGKPLFEVAVRVQGIEPFTKHIGEFDHDFWFATEPRSIPTNKNSTVSLIAGIANPAAFEQTVQDYFERSIQTQLIALEDHAPVDPILAQSLLGKPVLMTAKDAVKWRFWAQSTQQSPADLRAWGVLIINRDPPQALIDLVRSLTQ
jgi:tetraacyldisaccharide 4'-kinase